MTPPPPAPSASAPTPVGGGHAGAAPDTRPSTALHARPGPLALAPGQRPLPDYRLVRPLGRGGFGEVWQATGPGGMDVALKFIHLDHEASHVETRALDLMRNVRHPHLLAMFGAWVRADFLIIAMELADGTLLGRLREVQGHGHAGIPGAELFEYLREAAKALDFLNEPTHDLGGGRVGGIQHQDIKPQNLLLVGGSVKVADFGLAAGLERTFVATSGHMTPGFAPPETFSGHATRWSDQYSLAVTYCQLRGGRLPYEGNPFQIMAGHTLHPPDLGMLPPRERPVVARALAKRPHDRWPSCRAFADAIAGTAQSLMSRRPLLTRPLRPARA